jgi:UDP-N-acetylmuramate dehydrogenase
MHNKNPGKNGMNRALHPPCVEAGVRLDALTTFAVGGPARFFGRPRSLAELSELLAWSRGEGLPWRLIGRGSNLLLPDEGLDALVLHLEGEFERVERTESGYRVGAGVSLPKLAIEASRLGLAGLERFVGIPATFGGAVTMNAGCLGAEVSGVVRRVRLVSAEGEEGWVEASEMGFAYRTSRLQRGEEVCTEVEIALGCDDPERLMDTLRTENRRRHQTQPYTLPSAGSVFKNPPGLFAGRLIEQAGLKGLRIGGAEVSPVHANFIVNMGGATAEDIVRLMGAVCVRVRDTHGVGLEPEIQLWGDLRQRFAALAQTP